MNEREPCHGPWPVDKVLPEIKRIGMMLKHVEMYHMKIARINNHC